MPQILLNLVAIMACAILAHVLPEATFLGAYAILGPAHYLTEISWLHDRQYFVSRPRILLIAALAALTIMLVRPHAPEAVGVLLALLGGLIAAGVGASPFVITLAAVVSAFIGIFGAICGWLFVAAIAVLLPTLLHVFGFTAMFMATGAMRGRRMIEWGPLIALLLASVSFIVIPTVDLGHGKLMPIVSRSISSAFKQLAMPGRGIELRLVGFIGFAYAYHYLNWFLKTGLLGWYRVPLWRLVLMMSSWVVIMLAYAQNIVLGLVVSLPLSVGHVLLELPLNVLTARRLLSVPFIRNRLSAS